MDFFPRSCNAALIKALALFSLLTASLFNVQANVADLTLPTENRALLDQRPEQFFMYVDRTFEGNTSRPWQGGAFGFVRTPVRIGGELVYTRFHGGIDIQPVRRDEAGNPLDIVRAISAGQVVHASANAAHSNYGKYVLVEHQWAKTPVYTLYAHLNRVDVQRGQKVEAGTPLGLLGFTGAGINRTRAHLHLEVTLLLHSRFPEWHSRYAPGTNYHGAYNGLNLIGIDVADLFLRYHNHGKLDFAEYIRSQPAGFRVAAPLSPSFELAARYPWLVHGDLRGAAAVEITFTPYGLPVAIHPSPLELDAPRITWTQSTTIPLNHYTRGLLGGSQAQPSLSDRGQRYIALIMGTF